METIEPESTVPVSGSTASDAPTAQVTDVPVRLSSSDVEDPDEDDFLAKFYAELGLEQDILSVESTSEAETAAPAVQTESEEETKKKLDVNLVHTLSHERCAARSNGESNG